MPPSQPSSAGDPSDRPRPAAAEAPPGAILNPLERDQDAADPSVEEQSVSGDENESVVDVPVDSDPPSDSPSSEGESDEDSLTAGNTARSRTVAFFGEDDPLEPGTARLILTCGVQWIRLRANDQLVDFDLLVQGRRQERPGILETEVSVDELSLSEHRVLTRYSRSASQLPFARLGTSRGRSGRRSSKPLSPALTVF